jgi:hypothetical protein
MPKELLYAILTDPSVFLIDSKRNRMHQTRIKALFPHLTLTLCFKRISLRNFGVTAVTMNTADLWDMMSCNLIDRHRCFGGNFSACSVDPRKLHVISPDDSSSHM